MIGSDLPLQVCPALVLPDDEFTYAAALLAVEMDDEFLPSSSVATRRNKTYLPIYVDEDS
jgi:hypothetical protein